MRRVSRTPKAKETKAKGEQMVYRMVWDVPWKGEYVLQETGDDLFRPCTPDEVVPNREEYYFQPKFRPNNFFRQSFSHLVEWKTIVELCETGHLFVKKDFSL